MEEAVQLYEEIISQIYFIRGRKVMLDSDLARIYGVKTKVLNQAVKRNADRFPVDFMFQLTQGELSNLMSQIVTSSWGGRRKLPFVFTEHGALMLASILNSPSAVAAGIYVVRAFVKLREILSMHHELSERITDLERRTFEKLDEHSDQLLMVFQALRELVSPKQEPREPVGFKIGKS
ncbi:MAG: ORF6N domain-containing protein [Bacteroidetes bacterium]|nr:ORF6N domain-containing protein [Bacteroidota bacterium]